MPTQQFVSVREAAATLGVSPQLIRKLARAGCFEGAIKVGTLFRIPTAAVERAKQEGVQMPERRS